MIEEQQLWTPPVSAWVATAGSDPYGYWGLHLALRREGSSWPSEPTHEYSGLTALEMLAVLEATLADHIPL